MLQLICRATGPLFHVRCTFQGAVQHPATPKREGAGLHHTSLPPVHCSAARVSRAEHCSTPWPSLHPVASMAKLAMSIPAKTPLQVVATPTGSSLQDCAHLLCCCLHTMEVGGAAGGHTLTLSLQEPLCTQLVWDWLGTGNSTGCMVSRPQQGGRVQPHSEEPMGVQAQKGCFI